MILSIFGVELTNLGGRMTFQSGENIGNKYLNTISGIAPNYCIV